MSSTSVATEARWSELERYVSRLERAGIACERELELSRYTYARTGGRARLLVRPRTLEQMVEARLGLLEAKLPFKIIGKTSNVLFLDELHYGVLVSTEDLAYIDYQRESCQVRVSSGYLLDDFVHYMADRAIAGFQGLVMIPGTMGGAIFMNAGAFRYEVKTQLLSVKVMREDGTVTDLPVDALELDWRTSIFKKHRKDIILEATFRAVEGHYEAINREIDRWMDWRKTYLEGTDPNLGSIFATKDIYSDIGRMHPLYFSLMKFARKYFHDRIREKNNKTLNRLTATYFRWGARSYPYSDKTLNTFVNRGCGSATILRYIDELKRLTGNVVPIENEILRDENFA